jgi:hypothetical protein
MGGGAESVGAETVTDPTTPSREDLAKLWVDAYGKIAAAPFVPHNCPLCSVGRLGAIIVPAGVGVSITLTCNADSSHHVSITSGAQANDQ